LLRLNYELLRFFLTQHTCGTYNIYNYFYSPQAVLVNLSVWEQKYMVYSDSNFLHNSLEHLANPYIYLVHLGWEKCNPNYSYYNCRDLHLIHFIHKGRGTLQIGDDTYHLQANDTFYIPPNVAATYIADSEDPWYYYYFAFNGAFAKELIHRTVFRDSYCSTMPDNTLMQTIIDANDHIIHSQAADICGIEQLFRLLSVLLCKDNQDKCQYVSQIQRYIQLHFAENLRISQLAEKFNINRCHLYRMFKDSIGICPEQYLLLIPLTHLDNHTLI